MKKRKAVVVAVKKHYIERERYTIQLMGVIRKTVYRWHWTYLSSDGSTYIKSDCMTRAMEYAEILNAPIIQDVKRGSPVNTIHKKVLRNYKML